jgi:hypothetical protein
MHLRHYANTQVGIKAYPFLAGTLQRAPRMTTHFTANRLLIGLLLFAGTGFMACSEGVKQPAPEKGRDSLTAAPSADTLPYRERLVQALQQLQKDVASKNKEAIAAYFRFPVASDDLQAFDIGESFDKAVAQNNHQVSQQLFLTHFDALYLNLEMQGMVEMFQNLRVDSLKNTSVKMVEASKPERVCTHYYSITIEGKEVTLNYGVNTSDEYAAKHPDEEVSECPEYAAFWTFTFDGSKLIFIRHQVAG